jgi:hypothetical protein
MYGPRNLAFLFLQQRQLALQRGLRAGER